MGEVLCDGSAHLPKRDLLLWALQLGGYAGPTQVLDRTTVMVVPSQYLARWLK